MIPLKGDVLQIINSDNSELMNFPQEKKIDFLLSKLPVVIILKFFRFYFEYNIINVIFIFGKNYSKKSNG